MSGIARQAVSPIKTVRNLETFGWLELGRGKVISKEDIENSPGEYPVYSSAFTDDGFFGKYGEYLFSDERVSWSIDGGGMPFYRHKHRYSLTNVSGWMRVVNKSALNTRYLYYAVFNEWYRNSFDYALKAHPSVIRDLYAIPLPTLEIQQRIADYLDLETAEIDAAVADLDRYVELLGKRKWQQLNEILESSPHSKVRLSVAAKMKTGTTPSPVIENEDGVPWLKPDGLAMHSTGQRIDFEMLGESLLSPAGTTYVCGIGTVGKVGYSEESSTTNQQITALTPVLNVIPKLFYFSVLTLTDRLRGTAPGSTLPILNNTRLGTYSVRIPDLDVQRTVLAEIESLFYEIDALIAESTKLRDLLLKRRSVLITEVVTGRKQV